MDKIIEIKTCTGCTACENICPKKAITMKENEQGFKYPEVDKSKCIECQICKKICPILNQKERKNNIKAYACYNKNDIERNNSSSGGLFILLAKKIIEKNGVVFGAYLNTENKVVHGYAQNLDEIKKFMGSKYVQSDMNDNYQKVKDMLQQGKQVLFSGTPCQIEGLYAFLKIEYGNLYTIDIICHGVPSPLVWEKYLNYRKKKDKQSPKKISFRNKDNGWNLFNMKFTYQNAENYTKKFTEDIYMKSFLCNISLRDSCYNCSFKKINRKSDITLGDFWGIENIYPQMTDNKGVSAVIINSSKGQQMFSEVENELVLKEVKIEEIEKYNSAITKSVLPHKKRKQFFEEINKLEFDKLIEKTTRQNILKRIIKKLLRIIKH